MNPRRRRRLADVGFFALLCLIVVLTWAGLSYHSSRLQEQVRETRQQIAQRDVRHLNAYLGQLLHNIDLGLKSLLDTDHDSVSTATWTAQLDRALHNAPYLRSISVVDEHGRIIASTTADNIGISPDLTDYLPHTRSITEILRIGSAHAGRDLANGTPLTDPRTLTPELGFIPVIRGLTRDEGGSLMLLATLNMDYLLRILGDFHTSPSDRISLIRQDGSRLLDTATIDEAQLRVEQALVSRWRAGEYSTIDTAEDAGEPRLLASSMLNTRLPIAVASFADLDQALADAKAESHRQAVIVLPLMALGIGGVLTGYILFRRAGLHERALRRQTEARQRLLESALNASATAVVITRTDASIEWVNPAFGALTGFSIADALGRKPKDLVNSGQQTPAYYEALWRTILQGDVWRGELVNRRKDGSLYDEALTITPIRDLDGHITHFVAVKEEITARKAAQGELEGAHARLQTVVDSFPGAVVMEDTEGSITLLNHRVFELLGIPRGDRYGVGEPMEELTFAASAQTADDSGFIARLAALRAQGTPTFGEEIQLKDGRWLERDFLPIRSGDRLLGYLRIYRDVTPRKEHEQELHHLATTDPLTGAHNRRAFVDALALELARTQRYATRSAVLMFDLDHFKRINDQHGHAAGDLVLMHVVELVNAGLRDTDSLGRLGGEEFGILLPETDMAGALEIGERLRALIEASTSAIDGKLLRVTVSIGVAALDSADPDTDSVLAKADHAMYRAKNGGRNRVESVCTSSPAVTAD